MTTKKELEAENKTLKEALGNIRSGHTIQNCSIDMNNDEAIAIAEAVKAGMEALKHISNKKSYGIYIEDQ